MLLIKNAQIYSPKFIGKKDLFCCGGKIIQISDEINISLPNLKVIDAKDRFLTPGLIDKHVHITGGGGEGGFNSRAIEIGLSKLISGGITTVVGLLGTDSLSRSVENIVAKANALTNEGISAYAHTGSYAYPSPTLTGDVGKDIAYIDKILGIKIAISDHRSSCITRDELARLVSKGRVAGMLSGKLGYTTFHVGDGKKGLGVIYDVLNEYDLPIALFQPTHLNRNQTLFKQSMQFLKDGGYADYTCYSPDRFTPYQAIADLIKEGVPLDKVTMSSDGYGSYSKYDKDGNLTEMGVASVMAIYNEFKVLLNNGFSLEDALPFVTSNVARSIGLGKFKGQIFEKFDADMLILDKDYNIDFVIAKGEILKDDSGFIKKGSYENAI
ncbi:MAG: beta-aspartyl-peptidase [Campylobacter sp.]|nr:beta-aspartyl-peptidase [Campylobacter sp.]